MLSCSVTFNSYNSLTDTIEKQKIVIPEQPTIFEVLSDPLLVPSKLKIIVLIGCHTRQNNKSLVDC